jgi:putative endonuclease
MDYFLYILFSNSINKYYIGSTNDPERRLTEHNFGHTSSTKAGVPWTLVFAKRYDSKSEAIKMEKKLNRWKIRILLCGL